MGKHHVVKCNKSPDDKYNKTYTAIEMARTSKALLQAYRDRAVVLRELIAKYS